MQAGTALIAGAGIGGLTAALALADRGWQVTLVERRTGFSEVGAGLQLSPNASRILVDLGLGPALRRAAAEPSRVAIRALRSGRTIGEVELGPALRGRFGAPYLVIHRADLQTILLDAVRSRQNVRLLMGRTATGVTQDSSEARVALLSASGAKEMVGADVVVAADGVWSKLRRAAGDSRLPSYKGFAAWRATLPAEAAPPGLPAQETGLWLGPQGHVVHYAIAGGRLLNIVVVEARPEPVEGWAAPGDRPALLETFADAAAPLRALLAQPSEWLLWSLFDLTAGHMAKGRLALLGDAAHPVLPFLAQGAALAIEDAAVLARTLSEAPDAAAALRAYEAQRLPRARKIQRAARQNGLAYHAPSPLAFLRDRIIGALGATGMVDRHAWIYGWRP